MTDKQRLEGEARRLLDLLLGKRVSRVFRHQAREVGLEFDDGTRFFVDWQPDELDLSVTTGGHESDSES